MKSLREILSLPPLFAGFGAAAQAYDKGRPDYPNEIDGWLRQTLQVKPPRTVVLDLGSGTGKFTQRLLGAHADVIAVEPELHMREKFSRRCPEVRLLEGQAEAIPLPAASVDVVVCAQSFHLFANPEALTEIHRVLKPGGRLGLVWNLRDIQVDWVAQLAAIVQRYAGDYPRYYSGEWRTVLGRHYTGKYAPLVEKHWHHGHTGAPEDVIVRRIKSISFIANLPSADQARILDEVRTLIATHPDLAGKEQVTVPYDTVAMHTVKILP
ncbi:class I SAM-dependent methyltransferase [Pseudomonas typographi]|uniref:Methyltransferase domain-containing protein n=1 Tax=Pseudomonas typographi TaxID=2715964 RepID=A0ABR7Z6M7_9PSED|nr:class I SAM-dependent methyltransferase [Pseudomonas typographi]MBD1553794.1 methyltransferase domain-containing protein [Pseudomonas typographi]MBD1601189.1 methyltransferase domain-containing protein [Pseudomonas typographi]